jgi:hypothetical protein
MLATRTLARRFDYYTKENVMAETIGAALVLLAFAAVLKLLGKL